MSTGLWNTPGVPHKGWALVETDDHGAPSHECEMCQAQLCRYVHTVEHPEYGQLAVGSVCAQHLCQMPGLKSVERRLLRAQQRARSLEWHTHENGSAFCQATIGRMRARAVVLAVRRGFGAKLTIGGLDHYSEFTTRAAAQKAIETSIAYSARQRILSTLTA